MQREHSSKRVMFQGNDPAAASVSGGRGSVDAAASTASRRPSETDSTKNRNHNTTPRHHEMVLEGSWSGNARIPSTKPSRRQPTKITTRPSISSDPGQDPRENHESDTEREVPENIEAYASTIVLAPVSKNKKETGKVRHDNTLGDPVYKDVRARLIAGIMKLGIRNSIESISHADRMRALDPSKDFTYKAKKTFDLTESKYKEEIASGDLAPFQLTGYSPMCYTHMRDFLAMNAAEFAADICNSVWTVSGAAKSNSLLYFAGPKYVIKTMSKEESKFLRRILHLYYHHIRNNPHTLLPKYYGHFSISFTPNPADDDTFSIAKEKKISFIIMNNVFEAGGNKIHKKYDLKGSRCGRWTEPGEGKILKDTNLNQSFLLGPGRRRIMLGQIARDVQFLQKCAIMDYSFLVGIHNVGYGVRKVRNLVYHDERCLQADEGGMIAEAGGEVYYFGIIDILQRYNGRKRAEYYLKGVQHDRQGISAVPPAQYAVRFFAFIEDITDQRRVGQNQKFFTQGP